MNNLTQGDRVFHPNKKAWGLGRVLSVSAENIDVFFVGTGSKRLAKSFVQLEVVEGAAAKHPLLDNLGDASQLAGADYVSLPTAAQRFLDTYPDGFVTSAFVKEEREPNLQAHQFCIQLLGEKEIAELIAEHRYPDICDRVRHVESVSNLLTKAEKTPLYAALDLPENQKIFAVGFADLLYGKDSEEYRFKLFLRVLDLLEIKRWHYATLFGFIRFPQEKAFIKPTEIQSAAKALCWRINYKPEANWASYTAILRLYNHLFANLAGEGLSPRDMIDVHAFIASVGRKK